jgi:hypothetical protein
VLVRVVAVGVCHSDWHLVTGATKHPMPLGARSRRCGRGRGGRGRASTTSPSAITSS